MVPDLDGLSHGLPVLFALFVWWFSTGLILYLNGLPRPTYRWSLLAASGFLVAGMFGLHVSRLDPSPYGAYVAFTCAVLVWGWNEMAFLMGFLTGPRREACPEGCNGWRHVRHAVASILWHELAIAASGVLVLALLWNAPNQVGAWTFLVLWVMRLSAKLNVFLGVPNLSEALLPDHLRYLTRFFTRRGMNQLFPLAITASTVVTTLLALRAVDPRATAFEATGSTLVATMMALAVLEHWLLVAPISVDALWGWGMRSRSRRTPPDGRRGGWLPS